MASKDEIQSTLKDQYGINKNITQPLSKEDCERLLYLFEHEESAVKLVQSYASKNSSLSTNNATFGRARSQAERKLEALREEYLELEKSVSAIEDAKRELEAKKAFLEEEQKALEIELNALSSKNQDLASKVQNLTSQNDELTTANTQLKKDNKALKTIVDQIRLRLAQDTKELLKYEDSQIRKAVIKLFQWTLG